MYRKSDAEAFTEIEKRLTALYSEKHTAIEVHAAVERARAHFEHSAVSDFLPLLVERRVRSDLRAR